MNTVIKVELAGTRCKIVRKNGRVAYCAKYEGLAGLFRKDVEITRRIGQRVCDAVKEQCLNNGFFTSDEMQQYGLNETEITKIFNALNAVREKDLVAVFAYCESKALEAKNALDKILEHKNDLILAEMWGDYVDWKKRRRAENGFLARELKERECVKVFDAALGDGCDSIHLVRQGFEVTSNEVNGFFLEKARENAERLGVSLNVTSYDWRELDERISEESFDAVTLLGNSLTYLFEEKDRLDVLKNFKKILKPGGMLLVDERNYQKYLGEEMIIGKTLSKKVVYCGEKVDAKIASIEPSKIIIGFTHESGLAASLDLYPFKKGELLGLLEKTGFEKITKYSDYLRGNNDAADFFQYAAIR